MGATLKPRGIVGGLGCLTLCKTGTQTNRGAEDQPIRKWRSSSMARPRPAQSLPRRENVVVLKFLLCILNNWMCKICNLTHHDPPCFWKVQDLLSLSNQVIVLHVSGPQIAAIHCGSGQQCCESELPSCWDEVTFGRNAASRWPLQPALNKTVLGFARPFSTEMHSLVHQKSIDIVMCCIGVLFSWSLSASRALCLESHLRPLFPCTWSLGPVHSTSSPLTMSIWVPFQFECLATWIFFTAPLWGNVQPAMVARVSHIWYRVVPSTSH